MSPRTRDIVTAAGDLLERDGWASVTMRSLGDHLGIKAPSLYKHVPGKPVLASLLTAVALADVGEDLHTAVAAGGGVPALLAAYRANAHRSPHLYRLATSGPLDRDQLPAGLEEWSGTPFFDATGDPYVAQALWSAAHGATVLELDQRYPTGTAPDRTWARIATAFGG